MMRLTMQEWLLGKMGAILHQEAKVSEVSDIKSFM